MRTVKYERIEFNQDEPEQCTARLAGFVLDVPYLVYLGVIPLRHVLKRGNVMVVDGGARLI